MDCPKRGNKGDPIQILIASEKDGYESDDATSGNKFGNKEELGYRFNFLLSHVSQERIFWNFKDKIRWRCSSFKQ